MTPLDPNGPVVPVEDGFFWAFMDEWDYAPEDGFFLDDPAELRAAADLLESHERRA